MGIDLMSRRGLMDSMNTTFLNISKHQLTARRQSITFPVKSRPWAFFVYCDTDIGDSDYTGRIITRVSAIWTRYSGGVYAGGRCAVSNSSGAPDHYAMNNSAFAYDDTNKTFTITGSYMFTARMPYYLVYATEPSELP